jgi:hypothetical protein
VIARAIEARSPLRTSSVPEPLAVLGGEDGHAAAAQPVDLVVDDHAPSAADHLDVPGALGVQELHQVLEVLDVAALVRRDRDALHVLLEGGVHDLLHRSVVAQMDHLATLRLEDPAHDVDRRVVAVEQARGSHQSNRVSRHVQVAHGQDSRTSY